VRLRVDTGDALVGFSDAEIRELLKSNAASAREQSKGTVMEDFYLKPGQEVSFSKTVGVPSRSW
jgi:hypothetical protein